MFKIACFLFSLGYVARYAPSKNNKTFYAAFAEKPESKLAFCSLALFLTYKKLNDVNLNGFLVLLNKSEFFVDKK